MGVTEELNDSAVEPQSGKPCRDLNPLMLILIINQNNFRIRTLILCGNLGHNGEGGMVEISQTVWRDAFNTWHLITPEAS